MNMKLRSRIIAGFSIAAFLMVSAACKQASNVETPKKPGTGNKTALTLDAAKVTVDSKNLTGSASPYSVELENGHKATLTADMVTFAEGAVTGFKDGDTVQTMLKVTVAGDKSTVSIELKDAAAQAKYTFDTVVINVTEKTAGGSTGTTALAFDAAKVTVDSKNLTGSASPYSVELENGHKATLTADMVTFAEGAVTGFKDGDTVQTMLKVTVAGDKSTVSIELKDAAAQAKYTFDKVVINITEKTAQGGVSG